MGDPSGGGQGVQRLVRQLDACVGQVGQQGGAGAALQPAEHAARTADGSQQLVDGQHRVGDLGGASKQQGVQPLLQHAAGASAGGIQAVLDAAGAAAQVPAEADTAAAPAGVGAEQASGLPALGAGPLRERARSQQRGQRGPSGR